MCDDATKQLAVSVPKLGATGCGRSGHQRPHSGEVRRADAARVINTVITEPLIVPCHVCSVVVSTCSCLYVDVVSPAQAGIVGETLTECLVTSEADNSKHCVTAMRNGLMPCELCVAKCCKNCLSNLWGVNSPETDLAGVGGDEIIMGDIGVYTGDREVSANQDAGGFDIASEGRQEMGYISPVEEIARPTVACHDFEAGHCGEHPGLAGGNADWLRILGPSTVRVENEGLFCTLWVVDCQREAMIELWIDIFEKCLQSACSCVYYIVGAVSQLRPCRIFAECMCRGDIDPDWDYILRGACFGYRVIDDDCYSSYACGNYNSITKDPIGAVMTGRLTEELENGLLTIVEEKCACTHALGSVPKGDSDFRAIVDCSSPAAECVKDHTGSCRNTFSYNSVDMVTGMLQRYDVLATVDISNAYRAVNTHPDSRERQGLAWDFGDGTIFMRDNRLCMGLSSSPFVFSKISDFVVRCLVREGFSECVNYLDDFCLIGRDRESCRKAQRQLVAILRRVGFYVSYKKLTPASTVSRFLGIEIDSVNLELRLPQDKMEKLHAQLNLFVRRRKASKRELEGLGGILAHCCKVVKGGRTFSRRVYDMISSVKRNHHKVRLNEDFRLDLRWWLDFAAVFNGKARIIPLDGASMSVYSDASLAGFGATHGDDWLAGFFGEEREAGAGGWLGHHLSTNKDIGCNTENINVLELWPILEGVRRWGKGWTDTPVVFVTDNTQVQAALNTGRSRNKTTMGWLRLIFWESVKYNFEISSVYINTRDNIICDSLSRLTSFKNIARIRDADVADMMCCHHIFKC